jgi:G3E family GTPase
MVAYAVPSGTYLTLCHKTSRASRSLSILVSSLISVNRDTGVIAIESLMERRGAFDYILLETTGLADPGNIAPLFWVDDGLGSSIYLDGIVTVVDTKNILRLLDGPALKGVDETFPESALTTAHLQISHADVIILNKSDLVSTAEMDKVKGRITSINGLARVHVTDHSQIPQIEGMVLELHAYDNMANINFNENANSRLDPVGTSFSSPEQSGKEGGESGKKNSVL